MPTPGSSDADAPAPLPADPSTTTTATATGSTSTRGATVLVLGGASDIGLAAVARIARDGIDHLTLAVRDVDGLAMRLRDDPIAAGRVDLVEWDALDPEAHDALISSVRSAMGRIDIVICAVGLLGHHAGLPLEPTAADLLLRSNFSGPATAVLAAAHALIDQRRGELVVISSVAGSRSRRSNFVYGSAKAGLDAFAQGLADALVDTDVRVHIIRPGFVRSKMTTGLQPAPFSTTPEVVADAIAASIASSKQTIVWVPRILGPMMAIMRLLPRAVWRRVSGDR